MVKVVNNVEEFARRFKDMAEKARYQLASQVLADANKHVRADTWNMRNTSLAKSDLPKGLITWDTPYARRVYYTGTPSTDQNADAELMWVHVARDRYGKDWLVLFRNLAMKEVLQ